MSWNFQDKFIITLKLSLTFFRWCKVLTLLSHIYHYIISIYKAIGCQWLVCLFAFWSLTPPKQQTPIRWNFETWFPLGCRGFQAKKNIRIRRTISRKIKKKLERVQCALHDHHNIHYHFSPLPCTSGFATTHVVDFFNKFK